MTAAAAAALDPTMKLPMLTSQDKLTEIRRLYFATTKQSIANDFARALQLLKAMETEEERERATVYMEGLSQMQKDWARETPRPAKARRPGQPTKPGPPGRPGKATAGKVKPGATAKPAGPKRK